MIMELTSSRCRFHYHFWLGMCSYNSYSFYQAHWSKNYGRSILHMLEHVTRTNLYMKQHNVDFFFKSSYWPRYLYSFFVRINQVNIIIFFYLKIYIESANNDIGMHHTLENNIVIVARFEDWCLIKVKWFITGGHAYGDLFIRATRYLQHINFSVNSIEIQFP